jgi:hypothetical protein
MRLNEIERKFLACKRKIEEEEKERQQRSVAATHPERLLTVRSFNVNFQSKIHLRLFYFSRKKFR